jgi:hypothetical protein
MRAAVVPFARGAGWIADGWRMFRVAPLAWVALVVLYWMMMSALGVLSALGAPPQLGVAVGVLLVPAFSVGFMAVSRSCSRGAPPRMGELFEGFRAGVQAQLALGALYLALLAAILWATTLADDGALSRWILTGERPDERTLLSEAFQGALVVAATGYAPVMMLYWFAPVLAAWHRIGAAKALFFSFVACLMNWRAFLGYGVAAALVAVAVPFAVLTALLVLSGGRLRMVAMGLVLPIVLALLPILYASFFASYRDVFGAPQPGGGPQVG